MVKKKRILSIILCICFIVLGASTQLEPQKIYPYADSQQTIIKIVDDMWSEVIDTITVISIIDNVYVLTHKDKPNRYFEKAHVRDIQFLEKHIDKK